MNSYIFQLRKKMQHSFVEESERHVFFTQMQQGNTLTKCSLNLYVYPGAKVGSPVQNFSHDKEERIIASFPISL